MLSQILSDAPVSEIDIHADADWAGCPESRRSTSGFCLFVSGNLIHSASRTQGSVAMSSAESELYALCTATSEGIFLRNLMDEAGMPRGKVRLNIFTDSSAAKSIGSRIGPEKIKAYCYEALVHARTQHRWASQDAYCVINDEYSGPHGQVSHGRSYSKAQSYVTTASSSP